MGLFEQQQLIPTEILGMPSSALIEGKGVVYFSPARTTILGLPSEVRPAEAHEAERNYRYRFGYRHQLR